MKKIGLCLMVLTLSVAVQANLRAYWTFDEGSGTIAKDYSGNGNHGLLKADTEYGDPAQPMSGNTIPDRIAGVRGTGALLFSAGSNNYNSVWVARSDSLKDLMGTWSFSMWLREDGKGITPGGVIGYARVISCPNYEIELGAGGNTPDYFWPYENGPFQKAIGANFGTLGEWYHLALTYDGQYLRKYLNGNVVSSTQIVGQGLLNLWDNENWDQAVLKLGCQVWPCKDWFRGAMDDVAIWGDQCLTAAEVMGLYSGALTPLDIPEPASLALLAMGGLLLRKKK